MRHFLSALLAIAVTGCTGVPEGVEPVGDFDLDRYLGRWYEIARLDHSFERGLDRVTAEYSRRDDGGVKVVKDAGSFRETAESIIGMQLVTPQTGAEGVEVKQVLIEEGLDIDRELYVAVTLDRAAECPVVMASTEGGTEIEEVAETNPDAILKEWVHLL